MTLRGVIWQATKLSHSFHSSLQGTGYINILLKKQLIVEVPQFARNEAGQSFLMNETIYF